MFDLDTEAKVAVTVEGDSVVLIVNDAPISLSIPEALALRDCLRVCVEFLMSNKTIH